MKHLVPFVAGVVAMLGGLALAQIPGAADTTRLSPNWDYEARLSYPSLVQGVVDAAGVRWMCSESVCRTSGPWENPGVDACRALARIVGEIAWYGRETAYFAPGGERMRQCNSEAARQPAPAARPAPQANAFPPISFAAGEIIQRTCTNCAELICADGETVLGGGAICGAGSIAVSSADFGRNAWLGGCAGAERTPNMMTLTCLRPRN
jgi:hypothetical protein